MHDRPVGRACRNFRERRHSRETPVTAATMATPLHTREHPTDGTILALTAPDPWLSTAGRPRRSVMKLAFLDLPDERVDLISKARHDPNIQIVLVAHPDPEALALRIAEVLQIPRSTEPLDLLPLKPDRVALPSLASPSAAALVRAGISNRIFVTLDDLSNDWPAAPETPPAEESNPIEMWESRYDEAVGSARLS